MNIRLRTKKLIYSGLIGAGVMLLISGISGYVFYKKTQESELQLRTAYQEELNVMKETVQQNEEGWSLNVPVERGGLITQDMLTQVALPLAASSEDAVTPIDLTSIEHFAKTDLEANTVLVMSMLDQEEALADDVREGEYSFIELPSKLQQEDYIDVRIQFPNGDDYILLTKKKVKDHEGITVWVDMDEGDQLMMSSAIVDAYVEEGKIYAMPYIDGPMQADAAITYPVKENVLQLIKETPNIVSRAKLNLETQNRQRLEAGLREMPEEDKMKLRQKESTIREDRNASDRERELNEYNQEQAEKEIIADDFEGDGN